MKISFSLYVVSQAEECSSSFEEVADIRVIHTKSIEEIAKGKLNCLISPPCNSVKFIASIFLRKTVNILIVLVTRPGHTASLRPLQQYLGCLDWTGPGNSRFYPDIRRHPVSPEARGAGVRAQNHHLQVSLNIT